MPNKEIKLGPQGERDALYMCDPWYGYSTSVLKSKGLRGVPEYHNYDLMEVYSEFN